MKHTPGEWKIQNFKMKAGHFIRTSFAGSNIAIISEEIEEHEANARLISAAPDLLAACKGALAALEQNKTYPSDIVAAKSFLNDAISKAEKEDC